MYPIGFSEFTGYLDAQDEYRRLRETLSVRQATEQILESMKGEFEDYDDGPFCWIGLAKAQIRRKELMDEVAVHTLDQLEIAIHRVAEQGMCFRKKDLQQFREKLFDEKYRVSTDAADIIPKQIKKREYRCPWQNGDVFAYQLKSDKAKESRLYGRYCLVRKVDEEALDSYGLPRTWPIVYIMIWDNIGMPQSMDEIQSAGYIQTEDRMNYPAYRFDLRKYKWIDLTPYRIELKIRGRKQLENYGFKYLGNYPYMSIPAQEAVMVHSSSNIEKLDEIYGVTNVELKEFEKKICELYDKYGISYPELKSWDSELNWIGAKRS